MCGEEIFWKGSTVLVAAGALYVAYQQFRLGREKFKLDLFDKRMAVFSAARRFLSHIVTEGRMEPAAYFAFQKDVAEATFLFGEDISHYLQQLGKRALGLKSLESQLKRLEDEEARLRVSSELSEALQSLTDELLVLKTKFTPYLKFEHWH